MLKIVKNWGVRRNANVAFASHLCPRFPPHFFWKQQIYANPFFWFFTFSVILADLHADTEKKRLLLPVVSRMSGIYPEFWAKIMEITIRKLTVHLTLGRTRKVVPPPWYKGGGGWWNPPLGFLISCNISKRFCLHWKAFDILYKMRYILWVVALLEVCDVTKHGHRLGRHLGFYQELEMRWKQWELTISCA